ncbi:MAG TPA: AMP-binding protein [Anaerovoracaceae bacterium]|nr:AMP-binding protein [Anaerovoracaceae bacterium]
MEKFTLDKWIQKKISFGNPNNTGLTRAKLSEYQIEKVNETLDLVSGNSKFYERKLKGFKKQLYSLDEITMLPFTTAKELIDFGNEMLCVPHSEISRIVTLHTSGSTGPAKRVFFTEEDQELTVDYFHHGMQNLVDGNDKVLILLPCSTPGSVGDLLKAGLSRIGCSTVPYGFPDVSDEKVLADLTDIIAAEKVSSVVGSPSEVQRIAKYTAKNIEPTQIKTVLLSTDYISYSLSEELASLWGCRVFEHYGMTEMGLGGAVSCQTLIGYHFRENDLYVEIVNPKTGIPVQKGLYGEIVFTTLTRKGMPLIRYRTGDISRWLPGVCPCGSVLKRMDKVLSRHVKKGRQIDNNVDRSILERELLQ